MTSHLIFDFFGTLVEYSPSRTSQGYSACYAFYQSVGGSLDYSSFVEAWAAAFSELDAGTEESLREYSMAEAAEAFMKHASLSPDRHDLSELTSLYLKEWNKSVRYISGVDLMLERLRRRFDLSIITNTHDIELVPTHLQALGVSQLFSQVVTSVSFGVRKPSAAIFEFAMSQLSVEPDQCVYIGDSYVPDFKGPQAVGLRAFLIDPGGSAPIEDHQRISSILELEAALAAA